MVVRDYAVAFSLGGEEAPLVVLHGGPGEQYMQVVGDWLARYDRAGNGSILGA